MKLKDVLTSPIRYVRDRFFKKYPEEYEEIPNDSGKVIEKDGQKVAIYKDSDGNIHQLSASCTHLGCIVEWNDKQKRWDCPCHGSYFSKEGKVQKGPARCHLEIVKEPEDQIHTIEILKIEEITHDVKSFTTERPQGYEFSPGQATQLAVNENGYKDRFHPFTFTSLKEKNYLEFIIKGYPTDKYPEHSGVTERIHELKAGDEFLVKEPVGTIEYQGKGVFLAGGAGITPFIAIFRDLQSKDKLNGNTVIFSNKESRDVILEDELKKLFDKENLILTLTREESDEYEYGRIDKELIEKYIKDFDQYFYICGPSGFEDDITADLIELGASREKIVIEEW